MLGERAAGGRSGNRRPSPRAPSQKGGSGPTGSAVSRHKMNAGPQQVQNQGLRSARDEYRTFTPNGSCVAFATPPLAADRPLQTRHTLFFVRTPTRLAPVGRADQRPDFDCTPMGPPGHHKNLLTHNWRAGGVDTERGGRQRRPSQWYSRMLRVVGRSGKGRISLSADAWLPRPRAAQPSPNRADTTPIPTEYKRSKRPRSGTLRMRLR